MCQHSARFRIVKSSTYGFLYSVHGFGHDVRWSFIGETDDDSLEIGSDGSHGGRRKEGKDDGDECEFHNGGRKGRASR